jgi:5-(carboxyamino)imidazole ribonucleotide synthase
MIFPDAMLGMLGGGQLGRMFTLAAHSMGYRVAVLDPDPLSPAGAIADVHLKAACAGWRIIAPCARLATPWRSRRIVFVKRRFSPPVVWRLRRMR